jgi:hypothetical protein
MGNEYKAALFETVLRKHQKRLENIKHNISGYKESNDVELKNAANLLNSDRQYEELIVDILLKVKYGRFVELPCEIGDTVYVNAKTLPYNYLHPLDGCKDFAECKIISFAITKSGVFMKMDAPYPSRMNRRGYLRYSIGAIGKTVFLNKEEARASLSLNT